MNKTHSLIGPAVAGERQALLDHPLYERLASVEDMRIFMEYHVFAVWDFMSLLKSLQRDLTCVQTPWLPTGDARTRRLVNEIVLGEESDQGDDGVALSHFDLYLRAMAEAAADTRPIEKFIALLRAGSTVHSALAATGTPGCVQTFVRHTFDVIEHGGVHEVAAAFTYGREDLIPDLFSELVTQLQREFPGKFDTFRYYLDRHIELDGDEHGELGRIMVDLLCAGDPRKQSEAQAAAKNALQARIALWDGISETIANSSPALAL